jgi:ketosteroid isomerase-like protein
MTVEQQTVVDANDRFYAALSAGDRDEMARLWFPAEWACCVHPGGTAIHGWVAVRDSLHAIFDRSGSLMVTPAEEQVRLVGDIAWITCLERIASAVDGQLLTSLAQATNIFVRHDGEWRMVMHHASPIPFVTPPMPDGGNLIN